MVEETTNPQRDFPRAFFIGITITGVVYMLVAFFTTALVPIDVLRDTDQRLARGRARRRAVVPARGVLVHRDGRRRQHVVDQSHDGVALACTACRTSVRSRAVRRRARAAAHAVGRDHLHDGARARARELERRAHARRHDGAAAALRVRDRELAVLAAAAGGPWSTRTIGRRRCAPCSASCLACISRRRLPAARRRSTSSPACCCCSASRCS